MALRHQVTKLSNPRHAPKRDRKMSPKQIRYFGTARQKAALKAHRKRTAAPKASVSSARRSPNPAWVVTLGANPHHKRSTKPVPAAKTKNRRRRASNARRRVAVRHPRRVAARNPHRPRTAPVRHHRRRAVAVTHRRRRRAVAVNPRRRRRSSNPRRVYVMNRRKRNPSLFGTSITSSQGLKMIGAGFVGLIGAKFLPTLIPASMGASFMSSNLGRVVVTGAAGYLTAVVAGKVMGDRFGDAALFGAIIQTGSVALNAFLPAIYKQLGIGLGDFVPGRFSVPQNPLLQRQQMQRAIAAGASPASSMAPTGAVMVNSGMGRAYPAAY